MSKRLPSIALAAITALAITAPLADARGRTDQRDLWTGTWLVGTKVKNEDGKWVRQVYGEIDLKLLYHRNDEGETVGGKNLIGEYTFSGGGTVNGSLDERWGDTMNIRYKDGTGEGKAWGTLAPNDLTFAGGYRPCWQFCGKRPWWGKLVDTDY